MLLFFIILRLGISNCSMSVFYHCWSPVFVTVWLRHYKLIFWRSIWHYFCIVIQLPVGVSDPELEERIIQHLAAAAAMGRTGHFGRGGGQRNRSSPHGRPHFLVFSTHPGAQPSGHVSSSLSQLGRENEPAAGSVASPSTPLTSVEDEPSQQTLQLPPILTDQSSSASGSTVMRQGLSFNNRYRWFSFIIYLWLMFFVCTSFFMHFYLQYKHAWINYFVLFFSFLVLAGALLVSLHRQIKIEQGHQNSSHFQSPWNLGLMQFQWGKIYNKVNIIF